MKRTPAVTFLVLFAFAPAVQAHGVAPDEVFRLLLADDDGLIAYGGCIQANCPPDPMPPARAHDAVAVEIREAADRNGTPVLIFRFLLEPAPEADGRGITMTGLAAAPLRIDVTLAGNASTATLGTVKLPYEAQNLTAVELLVPNAALGLQAGDALQDVRFNTTLDGDLGDIVPGGWYRGDTLVPHVPHEAGELMAVTETPATGQVTLLGPAPLLRLAVAFPQATPQGWVVRANVTNQLGEAHQDITVAAAGQSRTVMVPAGLSQDVELLLPAGLGNVTVRAYSDFGAYEEASVILPAIAAKQSPAPALWLALLAALALARRR